jgi:hypothetical protein
VIRSLQSASFAWSRNFFFFNSLAFFISSLYLAEKKSVSPSASPGECLFFSAVCVC